MTLLLWMLMQKRRSAHEKRIRRAELFRRRRRLERCRFSLKIQPKHTRIVQRIERPATNRLIQVRILI